ncbi:MAG: hypothetical protein KF729_14125 [Sandaracinaceae bacterium]|nr:hypothetical protein [Sandaracinaceae bacterium]
MSRHAIVWLCGLALFACEAEPGAEDDKPEEGAPAPGVDPNLRIGHVMFEVGHRFESAGRAAQARNWGYAEYQVQEILEMFDADMTRAALPGDCNDAVADGMYESLLRQLPALRAAAHGQDAEAFARELATASGSCNGCHAGCNVPFIRVPSEPGAEVPTIALEAPPAARPAPEPAPPAEGSEIRDPWAR